MQQQIRTKEIKILNAENGDFDLLLRGQRQNPQQIITKRIRILNAHNGDFELMVEEDHTIEDALIQNTPMDEYYNDRVTTIGISGQNDVFGATQIKKMSFPNATTCPASYAFHGRNISLLEELYMPKLQTSGYGFAEANPNLRIIDFGKTFGGSKCRNCPNLETIVVRDTGLKNLGATWLDGCTKMLPGGSGGYVYVPQALLSQYEASQAWSDYANVIEFRAIEGSPYELNE